MGCIVGDCDVCNDPMYEGEWMFTGKVMHHETCKPKPKLSKKIEVAERLQIDLESLGIKSVVNMKNGELVINIADNIDYGR